MISSPRLQPDPRRAGIIASVERPSPAPKRKHTLTSIAFGFLWLLVLTIPLENALFLPGLGSLGRIVGLAAFVVAVLALLDAGKLRALSPAHLVMAAFVVWTTITFFWSPAPLITLEEVGSYFQLLAMVWLIWQLAPQRSDRLRLMQAYLVGAAIVAIAIIRTHGPAELYRLTAFNMNPNDVGLRLAMSIPIGLYLSAIEKKRVRVWLYGAEMVLASCALFLTASRGSVLALLASGLMVPLTFRKWSFRLKIATVVLVVVGAITAIGVVPRAAWERLGSTQGEITQGTMNDRKDIWKGGLEVFREHPFLGVGAGTFAQSVQREMGFGLVAHNTFLSVLVEQGIIGFGIFLFLLIALIGTAWKMPVLERSLWLVMLLVWAVGVAGMTWENSKPTWFLFGMLPIDLAAFKVALERSVTKRDLGFRIRPVPPFQPAGPAFDRTQLLHELHLKLQRAGLEEPRSGRTYEL
jgi:O-antigen ligase